MSEVLLVLDGQTFPFSLAPLLANCETFQANPSLLARPYRVSSRVSPAAFLIFLDALRGASPQLPPEIAPALALLCREFGFSSLSRHLSALTGKQLPAATVRTEFALGDGERCLAPATEINFGAPSELNSIIAHLTRLYERNVHDANVVKVMSSPASTNTRRFAARNVVDLQANSFFCSPHQPDVPHTRNNWICYDFGELRVAPAHYGLRSRFDGGRGFANLGSWVVEVSEDGGAWVQIDSREDNGDLNEKNVTRIFAVQLVEEGRFVRLVNIGRNH
jgi:hypothetical protein